MNKIGDILWKIFTSIVVFSCHTISNSNADEYVQTRTLCRAGYYVMKCGDHNVGTYWLKGFPQNISVPLIHDVETTQEQQFDTRAGTLRTRVILNNPNSANYYDYAGANNLVNLRKFFSDDGQQLIYTSKSGILSVANPEVYQDVRNNLLNEYCDPTKSQISCAKCPGAGNISASTVDITYDSGLLVSGTWNFHTIADCYMQEFSDSTGVFEYVDNENTTQSCYYANDVTGDSLVTENTEYDSIYYDE